LRRRKFITLLGGAAATWPLVAWAQQPRIPVIGFLNATSSEAFARALTGFRQGLKEAGYVEGQNVAIEYRWAEGQDDRLSELAADLVRHQVSVIVANGDRTALAAKAAANSIPIVFEIGGDPVKSGLVSSLNRPGGNITGVSGLTFVTDLKRLELLRELLPSATTIAALVNPRNPNAEAQSSDLKVAAASLGLQITFLAASDESGIDAAFVALTRQRLAALLVASDVVLFSRRDQIAVLANYHSIPAISGRREVAVAGGLMSYGTDLTDALRVVGVYAGRILKGEKPADLPVQQSTKVEFVINLKTAKRLGLTFPITLLGRADEVIE